PVVASERDRGRLVPWPSQGASLTLRSSPCSKADLSMAANPKTATTRKTTTKKKTASSKKLVVVESPTKAKTLERYLGTDYAVKASFGHIRDLPKNKIGVDTERNFEPDYV